MSRASLRLQSWMNMLSEPVMVLDEAEQTAVVDIPALTDFQPEEVTAAPKYQYREVTAAENAEEPEDTPEDKVVNGDGVHDVQGECDRGRNQRYDRPDDRVGTVVPTQHDEDVPRTEPDGYHVREHPLMVVRMKKNIS